MNIGVRPLLEYSDRAGGVVDDPHPSVAGRVAGVLAPRNGGVLATGMDGNPAEHREGVLLGDVVLPDPLAVHVAADDHAIAEARCPGGLSPGDALCERNHGEVLPETGVPALVDDGAGTRVSQGADARRVGRDELVEHRVHGYLSRQRGAKAVGYSQFELLHIDEPHLDGPVAWEITAAIRGSPAATASTSA